MFTSSLDYLFTVKPLVGRTGSGKSTLTLSLLRCILTEGEVYYDSLPISSLNLDALRQNITIIPQAVSEVSSPIVQIAYRPFGSLNLSVGH